METEGNKPMTTTATENRRAIMQAAWQIFRETYRYPAVPFRSIGRKCFAWALSEAHRRAKVAAKIAAIPAADKAARIAELIREKELAVYADSYRTTQNIVARCNAELARLAA